MIRIQDGPVYNVTWQHLCQKKRLEVNKAWYCSELTYLSIFISDATLAAEMGRVGDPHHDRFDNPVPCTVSVSAPRAVNNQGVMLENFEGSQFHLLDLGFWMDLTNPSVNGFSGGRLHGGTIAFGPEGADTKGCYHWLCPIYPISSTLCNTVAQTIGGMPDGRPIQLISEHKNLPNRKQAL